MNFSKSAHAHTQMRSWETLGCWLGFAEENNLPDGPADIRGPGEEKRGVSNLNLPGAFFNFFNNKKWFFAFFIKLIWLGVGFLNRTLLLYKEFKKKKHFIVEKIQKYRKCPALKFTQPMFYLHLALPKKIGRNWGESANWMVKWCRAKKMITSDENLLKKSWPCQVLLKKSAEKWNPS